MLARDPLPDELRSFIRLPHERPSRIDTFESVGVREDLRVGAQDNVDMVQVGIDPNPLRGRYEEVGRGCALLL